VTTGEDAIFMVEASEAVEQQQVEWGGGPGGLGAPGPW
jgi:hypothetical protein